MRTKNAAMAANAIGADLAERKISEMRKQVLFWFGDAVDIANGIDYDCLLCGSSLHTNNSFELPNIIRHLQTCAGKLKNSRDSICQHAAVALDARCTEVAAHRAIDSGRRGALPALSEQASNVITQLAASVRSRITGRDLEGRYHVGTS